MMAAAPTLTKSSALYAMFAWQIMMVRSSIATIIGEAERMRVDLEPLPDSKDRLPGTATEVGIIASVGRSVRADLTAVVRHNCAGAVFQIVYSIFENLAKSAGLEPGPEIRCGKLLSGEPLSRVLWASRNAFAHGDEWRRQGPKHPRAQESYSILSSIGFSDPASVNVYDVYTLISGASNDEFIQCVLAAGKELSEQATSAPVITPATTSSSGNTLLVVVVGLLALAVTYIYREGKISDEGIPGIIAFQHGSGDNAVTIPVAEGHVYNPLALSESFRDGTIKRLSAEAARPFKEVDARLKAWYASLDVLLAMNVEDSTYHDELMGLCSRAEYLYTAVLGLPNPFDLLQSERGISSMQEAQELMAEIYADQGFTRLAFREVAVDVINFKAGERGESEVSAQPT